MIEGYIEIILFIFLVSATFSFKAGPILYTVAVYHLKMYMKDDNPRSKLFQGR